MDNDYKGFITFLEKIFHMGRFPELFTEEDKELWNQIDKVFRDKLRISTSSDEFKTSYNQLCISQRRLTREIIEQIEHAKKTCKEFRPLVRFNNNCNPCRENLYNKYGYEVMFPKEEKDQVCMHRLEED